MYKVKNKIAPELVCELLKTLNTHVICGMITVLKLYNMELKYFHLWDPKNGLLFLLL